MRDPSTYGRLYLAPNTLGETSPLEVIPLSVKKQLEDIRHFVFEKEKAGRFFIKNLCPNLEQGSLYVKTLNKFTKVEELDEMLQPCLQGHHMALVTDAGCPGVADPGADLVTLAHKHGVEIVPMVGPSSILLALMASGLNGQSFAFQGYLPIDKSARKQAIKKFEKISSSTQQTQLFIETPYRNNELLKQLIQNLLPDTLLSVACDLTLPSEWIKTCKVAEWKKVRCDLHKRPAIFSFLRPH
ncbi:MAG: SAM-dependent methyltransferase [Flavobacteriaceae bacterium]